MQKEHENGGLREREALCRTYGAIASGIRYCSEQTEPDMRTMVACSEHPMSRMSDEPIPDEEGVDGWQDLLAWKCSTGLSFELTMYRTCRFVEAWVAVKRMRGDQVWQECLQEGKVRCPVLCSHTVLTSDLFLACTRDTKRLDVLGMSIESFAHNTLLSTFVIHACSS